MQLEADNAIDRVLAPVTLDPPQPTIPPTSPAPDDNVINFAERLAAKKKETCCA